MTEIPDGWSKSADELSPAERAYLESREESEDEELLIPEDEELLEDPIKVYWTGYARARIGEYNADFNTEGSGRFIRALDRQKTNIVIKTVEEAEAVATELNSYIGEITQRVWMNASMDKALRRVQSEVIEGMEERGYSQEEGSHSHVVVFT